MKALARMTLATAFACWIQGLPGWAAEGPAVGERLARRGDEIVVCGQMFHTTTPVVLWMDPGGYDAYRVERRFSPLDHSSWRAIRNSPGPLRSPNRFSLRASGLSDQQQQTVRGGGWPLELLQEKVDQFVIHYDVCGTSRKCFEVLHDLRGLSVHFMLDIDGTIYQTLDLKERAWHATIANTRSIGIEIANMGAYSPDNPRVLNQWYRPDTEGRMRIQLPESRGDGGVRTPGFVGYPARPQPIPGVIQDKKLIQYDLTEEQYEALARLTATLCRVFPKIRNAYPQDEQGELIPRKLPDDELQRFTGVLGHFHVQTNKIDPGPAFQFDWLHRRVGALLSEGT